MSTWRRTWTTSRAPTRRPARGCCPASPCSSSGRPRPSTRPARPTVSTSSGCRSARCPRRSAATPPARSASATGTTAAKPYADRVLAKLERYAPGVGALVAPAPCSRPAELERRNPNLVGGDSLAGSMHLSQNLRLRPFAGARDYETGVPGLLMTGAAMLAGRRRQRPVGLPRRAQAHRAPGGRRAHGGPAPASVSLMAHRVAIVGSGFGGLFAAKTLRRAPVEVTLVAATNHHLFQPLLYQVATGSSRPARSRRVTRDVLRRQRNVDRRARRGHRDRRGGAQLAVRGPDGEPRAIAYDSLILAGGMCTWYFGHAEFERFASGMKTLEDALTLRAEIFGAFERAELEEDARGAPGVADLRDRRRRADRRRAGRPDRRARAALPDRQLPPGRPGERADRAVRRRRRGSCRRFDERLSRRGGRGARAPRRRDPHRHGRHRTRRRAASRSPRRGGEERIAAGTRIWAAGVRAAPLAALVAQATGAATDRLGRVSVGRTSRSRATRRSSSSAT